MEQVFTQEINFKLDNMKFELNIGLANNALSLQGIIMQVYDAMGINSIKGFRIDQGEWEGEPEETVVITGETPYNSVVIVRNLAAAAQEMEQDSIAIASDQFDLLIYSQRYIGETIKFDNNYFIRYEEGKSVKETV